MLNTFEKTKAHEARRAAIQRQMEAMEAAASSRNMQSQQASGGASSATARRRTTQGASDPGAPAGSLETARRFLWDEDDDPSAGSDTMTQNPTKSGAKSVSYNEDNRSIYSSAPPKDSNGSFLNSVAGIFRGKQLQNRNHTSKMTNATVNLNDASSVRSASDNEYRPSALTKCYVFFRHMMLACALTFGSCYTWSRTRSAMAFGNGRGRRLCLLISIILVVVIPVAIFAPKKRNAQKAKQADALFLAERSDVISRLIVERGISSQSELTTVGTPQNLALQWIVSDDPAQLIPEHVYLSQRYALAVFYYSSHGEHMFQTSTVNITVTMPPGEDITAQDTEASAEALQVGETASAGDDLAAQPDWVNENGWMTGAGICSWYGIECHHRPGASVYETRYDDNNGVILFNMTENNVRGNFPKEIVNALKDIRWMSLSGNGIFGTLPGRIGDLTELRKSCR